MMKITDLHNKEAEYWKNRHNQCSRMAQCIWKYRDYIEQIKKGMDNGDFIYAGQLLNEIPFQDARLLLTAPTYGGVFTTDERATLKTLWEVSTEDFEND